jgi:TPP-dependent indolepyruvate ferredoxin oxidoreductase alpha subunit/Pyruvate/2-oxoacid:ferredoxin oxidoreductase gamma subunit
MKFSKISISQKIFLQILRHISAFWNPFFRWGNYAFFIIHRETKMHETASRPYRLDDALWAEQGRIFLSGTQALARLPLMQRALDAARGLDTRGFVSGYRGSPLGGLDQVIWGAGAAYTERGVRFVPAVNEELAATQVLGTQRVEADPQRSADAVFAMWYGKGPGVDRAADAIKHGNAYGASRHGGVLVVAGDDHGCASSSMPHQSDLLFQALRMPVLAPADVGEYLEFGLYGWALSRYSGNWVGFTALSEVVESRASVDLDATAARVAAWRDADAVQALSGHHAPADGLHYRWPDLPSLRIETRLSDKFAAVAAFARVNSIDRDIVACAGASVGIVTCGKAHHDLMEVLRRLEITPDMLATAGVRIYKVGLSFPLETTRMRAFCAGLREVLVIEEKAPVVETQLRALLYNDAQRPRIVGKQDADGAPLVAADGELRPSRLIVQVADWLVRHFPDHATFNDHRRHVRDFTLPELLSNAADGVRRLPYFCAGCPHNTSTRVPEGSHAQAGIGCHFMASWMQRDTVGLIQMGGEGVDWVSHAMFTREAHVFQNLGDGTYYHSGYLAIRQAVAAKATMTYKILYNDAVAMTGGQPVDGRLSVDAIARQVESEGVAHVAVMSDAPGKYHAQRHRFPAGTTFHDRSELDAVQRRLRAMTGVTVLIYEQCCRLRKSAEIWRRYLAARRSAFDMAVGGGPPPTTMPKRVSPSASRVRCARLPPALDPAMRPHVVTVAATFLRKSTTVDKQTCAAELRRRRRRGEAADPPRRLFIHDAVCEGCGDCSVQSNCVAVQPHDTPLGRRRHIDQSACNKDYTCARGFCPSFVEVSAAQLRRRPGLLRRDAQVLDALRARVAALPLPTPAAWDGPWDLLVAGVGGTGVVTVGALVAMAAHLQGAAASVLDFMGFAQKGGAVLSFVRLARSAEQLHQVRIDAQQADALLACDLVVGASADALHTVRHGRTRIVANTHRVPLAETMRDPQAELPVEALLDKMRAAAGAQRVDLFDAHALAEEFLGDSVGANIVALGYAWQRGLVPLDATSLLRAIELNGVAVDANRLAFDLGRLAAGDADGCVALRGAELAPAVDEDVDALLARHVALLRDWQDDAWAQRYAAQVDRVRRREQAVGGDGRLARTVARALGKLMSYKDEYEVARLYTAPAFRESLAQSFEGSPRIALLLAPPWFGARRKIRVGAWALPLLRGLARARGLRATRFDPFGYSAERRLERALIDDYQSLLDELLPRLDESRMGLAVDIAALPLSIRGFGHVKLAAADAARLRQAELLHRFDANRWPAPQGAARAGQLRGIAITAASR